MTFKAVPLLMLSLPLLHAQGAAFEVASLKPAVEPERTPAFCIVPCTPGERMTVTGARVDIRYMSLFQLILKAYRLKPHQLTGPDWMRTQRFDIAARMPDGAPKEQLPEMLKAMLAERFKLAAHPDTKELPVYALVVSKSGAKLRDASADPDTPLPAGGRALYTPQGEGRILDGGGFVVVDGAYGAIRSGRGPSGAMRMEFPKLTMPALAELLTPHADRPVVDMTDLKGVYYFATENRPPDGGGGGGRKSGDGPPADGAPNVGRPPDPFGDGLYIAIEKAGLKLEARKAPVETLVVDRLEKSPTAN